jgi:hypothetical protein
MGEWTVASIEAALRRPDTASRDWLTALDDFDAEIVRLRSSGARWKPICWQLGIGRATAHRRWKAGLRAICDKLNRSPDSRGFSVCSTSGK